MQLLCACVKILASGLRRASLEGDTSHAVTQRCRDNPVQCRRFSSMGRDRKLAPGLPQTLPCAPLTFVDSHLSPFAVTMNVNSFAEFCESF